MTTTLAQPPQQARFTPEDVARLEDQGLYELVGGQLVEKSMSPLANASAGLVTFELLKWCKTGRGGTVLPEQTIQCFPADAELVRRPDVAYFGLEGSARVEETGHVTVPPDLAVEVISPNDTIDELEEKIVEYFAAGVKMVWAVHPKFRWVRIHRPGVPLSELREADTLTAEPVLPGFSVAVRDLLPQAR
jgi:Uma2 family endonuclease